jgi:transcriptional regulator with XRE-family HTH domain
MTGHQLAKYRSEKKKTQMETARGLGVSQTYLSLLEAGKRRLTKELQRKAAKFLELPLTELPAQLASGEVPTVTDDQLASDLADLGYTGFSHLRRSRARKKNPADVLLSALKADKRDARLVEALPWLVLNFPDLKWNEVSRMARMYDLQNRLGYVSNVARRLAERSMRHETASKLKAHEAELERSVLAREDTLCNEAMTNAERRWLFENRPDEAKRWHVLTDMSPRHLDHYD